MKNRSDGQSIEKEYLIDGCCESENLMKARMRSGVDYEHDEEQLLLHSSTSYRQRQEASAGDVEAYGVKWWWWWLACACCELLGKGRF